MLKMRCKFPHASQMTETSGGATETGLLAKTSERFTRRCFDV